MSQNSDDDETINYDRLLEDNAAISTIDEAVNSQLEDRGITGTFRTWLEDNVRHVQIRAGSLFEITWIYGMSLFAHMVVSLAQQVLIYDRENVIPRHRQAFFWPLFRELISCQIAETRVFGFLS